MHNSYRKNIFEQNYATSNTSKFKYEFKVAWGGIPHPEKAWKGG